jgi:hypothetical protein
MGGLLLPDLISAILDTLAAAGREASQRTAERIAREITTYGGVDQAAAALAHDQAHDLLSDLLIYRGALAERRQPDLRIARLRQEADDLEARAEALWSQGAEFAGRASFRRLRGDADLAAVFQRKADSAERLAAGLDAEAFGKRLEATHMQAALARREAAIQMVKTVAA